jgi:hypothetical protein
MITEDKKLYWDCELKWVIFGEKFYFLPSKRSRGELLDATRYPEACWNQMNEMQATTPVSLGYDNIAHNFMWWFQGAFYRSRENLTPGMFLVALRQKTERKNKRLEKLRIEADEL